MADDLCLFIDGQAIYCCWVLFLVKGSSFGASPAAEPRQGERGALQQLPRPLARHGSCPASPGHPAPAASGVTAPSGNMLADQCPDVVHHAITPTLYCHEEWV